MPRDISWKQEIALPVGQSKLVQNVADVKVRGVYVGVVAPDFTATTLEQKPFKLSALRGKVVLIDFWATWCAPCVAEIPNVRKAWEDCHGAGGFEVVSVSFDRDARTARKFAAEKQMTWTQHWAEGAEKGPLADLYGVSAIPATFLIGRDGKVIANDLRGAEPVARVKSELAR